MQELVLSTSLPREVLDITTAVQSLLKGTDRVAHLFVAHTTCALTTADMDTGTDQDLLDSLENLLAKQNFRHPHDSSYSHVSSHLLASIVGTSITVPAQGGQLLLGQWQRIIMVELDGPRHRHVYVNLT